MDVNANAAATSGLGANGCAAGWYSCGNGGGGGCCPSGYGCGGSCTATGVNVGGGVTGTGVVAKESRGGREVGGWGMVEVGVLVVGVLVLV